MSKYKSQARRLRERLQRNKVEIPVSLSLEAIAAVHGVPNWDTLAASEEREPPYRYEGVHGQLTRVPAPREEKLSVVTGPPGSGKTLTLCAMGRFLVEETGAECRYWNGHVRGSGRECQSVIEGECAAVEHWIDSNPVSPGVWLIDEFDWLPEDSAESVVRVVNKALRSGFRVLVAVQRLEDNDAFMSLLSSTSRKISLGEVTTPRP